jgi:uncharacterized membrane protein (UPF0127 family)
MNKRKTINNKNHTIFILIILFIGYQLFNFNNLFSQNVKKLKPSIIIKGSKITVEVADTEKTREKGMMWRNQLGKNEGMLFIYNDSATRYFWMKNTFLALDMAFIDSNMVIRTIHTVNTLNDSTTLYSSYVPVKYVLEVNSGWFEEHGVSLGDTVLFDRSIIPKSK